jgi:hypothetical protein
MSSYLVAWISGVTAVAVVLALIFAQRFGGIEYGIPVRYLGCGSVAA